MKQFTFRDKDGSILFLIQRVKEDIGLSTNMQALEHIIFTYFNNVDNTSHQTKQALKRLKRRLIQIELKENALDNYMVSNIRRSLLKQLSNQYVSIKLIQKSFMNLLCNDVKFFDDEINNELQEIYNNLTLDNLKATRRQIILAMQYGILKGKDLDKQPIEFIEYQLNKTRLKNDKKIKTKTEILTE